MPGAFFVEERVKRMTIEELGEHLNSTLVRYRGRSPEDGLFVVDVKNGLGEIKDVHHLESDKVQAIVAVANAVQLVRETFNKNATIEWSDDEEEDEYGEE